MNANVDIDAGALDTLSSETASSSNQLYTQYADSGFRNSIYLRHGFSMSGFVFGAMWLIFHGLRGVTALTLLTLTGALLLLITASIVLLDMSIRDPGVVVPALAVFVAHLIIGFQGYNWRGLELYRRGWREIQLVAAPSRSQAQRFGDAALHRYRHNRRSEPVIASRGVEGDNAGPEQHFKNRPATANTDHDTKDISAWTDANTDVMQREVEVEMVGEEYREFVRIAQRELQRGRVNKAIWARAFATYADDVASVRRRYICLRAESLAKVETAGGDGFRESVSSAKLVARVSSRGETLSPEQMDNAEKQVDDFVDEVVQTRRFDRYSTDVVGSTLGKYIELNDQELVDRLIAIGLRLDVLSGPGSRDKPGFTEYRVVAETGDLLHLPDRSWFGLFLEKLYNKCREANVVVSHAYVHGTGNKRSVRSVTAAKRESDEFGATARDQFFRYMENNGKDGINVFQGSIDGPDVEVDELWQRQTATKTREEPKLPVLRDPFSADWVNGQSIPNRAERLRRERRVSATGDSRTTGRNLQDMSDLNSDSRCGREAPQHIDSAGREFLDDLLEEEVPTRIGVFRDTFS